MRSRVGFTLVELLVVIAIISMLAALLFPAYAKAREKGRQANCLSNIRQIGMAVELYAEDHGEVYPAAATVWNDIKINRRVFTCPSQPKATLAYAYSTFIAGKSVGLITEPVDEIVALDGQSTAHTFTSPADVDFRHNDGFIACYADGHAEWRSELPPMWYVEVAALSEMATEVDESSYPTVVFVYTKIDDDYAPEFAFSEQLAYRMRDLAKQYRLRVRFVAACGDAFPEVNARYGVIPGSPERGYPTVIFQEKGQEVKRFAGFPEDTALWEKPQWAEYADDCAKRIEEQIDAMLLIK